MTATPNILLIVLDALREDTLGDGLEVPGRCFRAPMCIAAAPWTLPSCTSIVTGVPATRHGRYWWTSDRRVPSLVTSLPDTYKKVGLVNNNMLTEGSGIDEGFDSWTYHHDHEEPFRQALRLIKRTKKGTPLFLLLHSNMSHDYYQPGAAKIHRQVFPEDAEPRVLNHRVISWNDTSPDERASVPRTYAACASRLTERVTAVLEAVRHRDDFVTCITADHGEGLDYERGRVHHGGRVHQDLVHVPLYFDLPSSRSAERARLEPILAGRPLSGSDVLPTLLALAGPRAPDTVDALGDDDGRPASVLVAEDRRYLYFRDRFRLNLRGRYKNMSRAERERNELLSDQLADPPSVRAFVRFPDKLTVTSVSLDPAGSPPPEMRRRLIDLGSQLPGAPFVALRGSQLFAISRHHLATDPAEDHNLVDGASAWPDVVLDGGWAEAVTVPTGEGDMSLAALADECEPIGLLGP
jgi:hypothetical protein